MFRNSSNQPKSHHKTNMKINRQRLNYANFVAVSVLRTARPKPSACILFANLFTELVDICLGRAHFGTARSTLVISGRQKISDPFTLNIMNIPVFRISRASLRVPASEGRRFCVRFLSSGGRLSPHKYRQRQRMRRITES